MCLAVGEVTSRRLDFDLGTEVTRDRPGGPAGARSDPGAAREARQHIAAASPPGPDAGARRPSRPAGRLAPGLSCSAYLAAPWSEGRGRGSVRVPHWVETVVETPGAGSGLRTCEGEALRTSPSTYFGSLRIPSYGMGITVMLRFA